MSSKHSHQSSNEQVESKVAASQTDTGAPNDQRAAASHASAPTQTTPPAGARSTQALGTVPDGGNEYVAHGTSQTWDGRREGAENPLGGNVQSPNASDGAKAQTVNEQNIAAGKALHDATPQVDTADVLAHSAPSSPLAAQRTQAAPIVHAPTVTPKGKLGYMATPSVPENGVAPGVATGGAQKADFFTKPIVETSVTKKDPG